MVLDGNLEKHIGCLAGFLQIFDPIPGRRRRHRLLRSSPRRLPGPSPPSDGGSACSSPAVSEETPSGKTSFPDGEIQSPVPEPEAFSVKSMPKTSAVPFPVFEFKEGGRLPWKFSKEVPRLSLDSRAVTDARGSLYPREIRTTNHTEGINNESVGGGGDEDVQRRSPSVIARLMGLENLPSSDPKNPQGKMELRRSASDSRVSKEIYQFIEGGNYSCDYPRQGGMASIIPATRLPIKETGVSTKTNARRESEKSVAMQLQNSGSVQRKSCYNSTDFFPEFNRSTQTVTLHEEIGKKLRARGINEPSKDLESLKQILEAMQLKGLLHCKAGNGIGSLQTRKMGFDSEESPIVLMRPRSLSGRNRSESQSPSLSPIRGRVATRDGSRTNSLNGRRPPEDRKKVGSEQGRTPLARSPRAIAARKAIPDHSMTHRTYQGGNFTKEKVITIQTAEDEASTVSESSISTPSTQTDTEKSKLAEGSEEGRSLLERCDKLLNSIAEMTAASAAAAKLQPSPVSVLDRSIYEEFEGPSLAKRGLLFKVVRLGAITDCSSELTEEDAWSPEIRLVRTKFDRDADDCDFAYVSDVVGASNYLAGDPDLFELLEKRWYLRGKDTSSPASRLRRKLTFDVVLEILDRRWQWLQWKHAPWTTPELEKADLGWIWSEYSKIRQDDSPSASEDLLESVRGILRKEISGNAADGWVRQPTETTESAVDIERLIFKDLIGETIRDLAISIASDGNKSKSGPRRKLAF